MATVPETCGLIENGAYDKAFAALYGGDAVPAQRRRYAQTIESFGALYGGGREISLYSAPGRTEIGGNHTDHNNGRVLAASVDLDIIAVVSKADGGVVRLRSEGFEGEDIVSLDSLEPVPQEEGRSQALIRGVAAGIAARGGAVGGFDAYTTSNVLKGSGLSSSAAFEVCLGSIFSGEFNGGRFDPIELGIIGQYAENVFFGKPSGLMDQLACAVGGAIGIDFEAPAQPLVKQVRVNLERNGYRLVITDTGGSHAGLTDEYAAVRSEMEAVAGFFGRPVLRQVEEDAFYENIAKIRKKCGDRALLRAMHYFEENRRVPLLAAALEREDYPAFLALIREGGHSSFEFNQNAYSAKHPAQQGVPLALALSQKALGRAGACRLQGGGFAGTIQAFVPQELLAAYCGLLGSVFGPNACHVLAIRNTGCTAVLPG